MVEGGGGKMPRLGHGSFPGPKDQSKDSDLTEKYVVGVREGARKLVMIGYGVDESVAQKSDRIRSTKVCE